MCRAHDSETLAAASASATAGWADSRRIHPIASDAAPPLIWVCHFSQVRVDPWPSSAQPSWAWNAARIFARAAVCIDCTRSRDRRQPACSAVVSEATSAALR
jgi:hypothetical protein